MKKITLILIALITVGCSKPNDTYIGFECERIFLEMHERTKTFTLFVGDDVTGGFYSEEGPLYLLKIGGSDYVALELDSIDLVLSTNKSGDFVKNYGVNSRMRCSEVKITKTYS